MEENMNDIYVRRLNKFYSNRKRFAKIRMIALFAFFGVLLVLYGVMIARQLMLIMG